MNALAARNAAAVAERREKEKADRFDFLIRGHEHEPDCLFRRCVRCGEPPKPGKCPESLAQWLAFGLPELAERCRVDKSALCSRDYDPLPYPEALPADLRTYDGTGVGALYGMSTEAIYGFVTDDRAVVLEPDKPKFGARSLVSGLAGWTLPGCELKPKERA